MSRNPLKKLIEPTTSAAALGRFRDRNVEFELVSRESWFYYVLKNDWFISTIRPENRNLDATKLSRRLKEMSPGDEDTKKTDVDRLIQGYAEGAKTFYYFDIGANYGQTAVHVDKLLKETGVPFRVLSFEPGMAADCMAINVEMNEADNVISFEAAFGDMNGFLPMFAMHGHTEDNKIVNGKEAATVFPVRSLTLDRASETMADAFRDGSVFLKIDTQGAEVEVLRGARSTMERHEIMALCEFSPLAVSSRIKPTVWLEEVQQHLHVVACGRAQNIESLVEETDAAREQFVDDVKSGAFPFCDVLLVSKEHSRIAEIKKLLRPFGVAL